MTAVSGNTVSVTMDSAATTLDLSSVTITSNGTKVNASSLKAGDVLTVTYKDGKIASVTVG